MMHIYVFMDKLFWKVLNWNIRGTNDPEKWPLILNKIKESGCHVICLQESKREHVDFLFLRNFCPRNFDSFAFVPSVGRSGGIITIWDSSVFKGNCVFHNDYALSVEFQSTKSDLFWTLTNIYAPCQDSQQLDFLHWLNNVTIPDEENWLLVGDFNLIRSPQDRNRDGGNVNEMLLFNEVISNLGLVDIPLKGRKYTWSNMRDSPLLQRLDWFFTSVAWSTTFPNTMALPLAMTTSDHIPCVISIKTSIPKSVIFRFENRWLQHPDSLATVEHTWSQSIYYADAVKRITAKFKILRKEMKKWSNSISSINHDIKDLNSLYLPYGCH
jgi:exonuclease III